MPRELSKVLLIAVVSLFFGLAMGHSTAYKEDVAMVQECEALLPRYQSCEITAMPVPEEPYE